MCKYLHREKNLAEEGRTRTNSWSLKPDKFQLEIRYQLFNRKGDQPLEQTPQGHVDSPSLNDLQFKLDTFPKEIL